MKKITVLVIGGVYALLTGCEVARGAPPVVNDTALIYFTGKNDLDEPGGKECSIGIQEKETFMGDTACKNDEVYFYRFDNVPSATLVTLDAENKCRTGDNQGDWQFTLRTIKLRTTTGWRKVSDLQSLNRGDIVTAGLMYEDGYYNKGTVGGKLSCVKVRP